MGLRTPVSIPQALQQTGDGQVLSLLGRSRLGQGTAQAVVPTAGPHLHHPQTCLGMNQTGMELHEAGSGQRFLE